jgi:hypothetical protein
MSWTFEEMHIYKCRLVMYRWWSVNHICKQGIYQCKLQEIFCVFTSTSSFKVHPHHTGHIWVFRWIFPIYECYCHYRVMLKPKMYVCHERLFILSTWTHQWKYHDIDFFSCIFYSAFILVEKEHAVSNTFSENTF